MLKSSGWGCHLTRIQDRCRDSEERESALLGGSGHIPDDTQSQTPSPNACTPELIN